MIAALVSGGCDPSAVAKKGVTPLQLAAARGHSTAMALLVKLGAEVGEALGGLSNNPPSASPGSSEKKKGKDKTVSSPELKAGPYGGTEAGPSKVDVKVEILLALNPQPSTLNPQPSTLNPQPSTLNPPLSTLNPQPSTLLPRPSTLNPSTRKP